MQANAAAVTKNFQADLNSSSADESRKLSLLVITQSKGITLSLLEFRCCSRDRTCPERALHSAFVLSQSPLLSCAERQVILRLDGWPGCPPMSPSSCGWSMPCSGPSQCHRAGRSWQRTLHIICIMAHHLPEIWIPLHGILQKSWTSPYYINLCNWHSCFYLLYSSL